MAAGCFSCASFHRLQPGAFAACDYGGRGEHRRAGRKAGVSVDTRATGYDRSAGNSARVAAPGRIFRWMILYEDEYLAVVNKPPGMVVHPARGHWSGTLASALQFHFGPALSTTGGPSRPGIVHRLDRDTSGAILVARNDIAHAKLSKQFHQRTIEKEYFALVAGCPERDRDYIDCPIGFHPHQREKMAIRRGDAQSRSAQTFYEVLERFEGFAAIKLLPKTGPDPPDSRASKPHRLSRAVRSSVWRAIENHAGRNPPRSGRCADSLGSTGLARPAFEIHSSRKRHSAGNRSALAGRHNVGFGRTAKV